MQTMGIAKASMGLAQQQLREAAGTKVTKMAMDEAEHQGQQMVDMLDDFSREMQRAVEPHRGSQLDLRG